MTRAETVSVVIPTYNRRDLLEKNLMALSGQDFPADRLEVIVVNDGCTDGTAEMIESFEAPFRLKHIIREHTGDMQFYNVGAREAGNDVILFLDDDVTPAAGLVREHLASHNGTEDDVGVIGRLRWPAEMNLSPFDDYVARSGMLMGTHLIGDPENVHFKFTLTGNFSVSREIFEASGGFSKEIGVYGYIDTEFGYRLQKDHGVRLVYNEKAVADHWGRTPFDKFLRRRELCGSTAVIFYTRHPELARYLKVEWARRRDPALLILKAVLRAAYSAVRPAIPLLEKFYPASRPLLFFAYRLSIFYNYQKGIAVYLGEVDKHGTDPFPPYPGER